MNSAPFNSARSIAASPAQLWNETQRLTQEIEDLQARLCLLMEEESEDESLWSVWPYSWAATGWNAARNRFHSFHENRSVREDAREAVPQLRLL